MEERIRKLPGAAGAVCVCVHNYIRICTLYTNQTSILSTVVPPSFLLLAVDIATNGKLGM